MPIPRLVLVALLFGGLFTTSWAQEYPPACQMAFDAIQACYNNDIHDKEISDPELAEKIKEKKIMENLRAEWDARLAQLGRLEFAKQCASKTGRQEQFKLIQTLYAYPMYLGKLTPECSQGVKSLYEFANSYK